MAAGMLNQELHHQEVLDTGRQHAGRFEQLVRSIVANLHE
jgi:purine nucleoside phosphorylase